MSSFLISLAALERNARILRETADAAGCKVVLALKGFACWKAFDAIRPYVDGCCASGSWEARLAHEHMRKHVITYSPAYTEEDIFEILPITHHLDFNSPGQWQRHRGIVMAHPRYQNGELLCGLRVNPQRSTGHTPLYDPCVAGSRLGITAGQLAGADLTGLSGLHFHTLCEQNSDDLESTLAAVDEKFGHLLRLPQFTYLNFGGGHWITKPFYDRDRLIRLIKQTRERYQVDVWIEPGEAFAIHTGVLRATVLDVFESAGHHLAILDVSVTAHMPDVLEMPYRPDVYLVDPANQPAGSPLPAVTLAGENYHVSTDPSSGSVPSSSCSYRLGGPTCLAGDVIGDFSFHRPLRTGDVLVFDDMAHYTMVKTTVFNGVKHPDITLLHPDGSQETVRRFTYDDFLNRLS
jgi:carboxynorspermidine decarboxylase